MVFEAPAFVTGFDDLAVMRQAVEERGGYIGIAPKTLGHSPKARLVETIMEVRS